MRRARDCLRCWNELSASVFDVLDTTFDLDRPRLFDVLIFKEARDQTVSELCALFDCKRQCLGFDDFKLSGHTNLPMIIDSIIHSPREFF